MGGPIMEVIPAATGRGFMVSAGQHISISQTEGGQVADMFAFTRPAADEHLSAQHTRVTCGRLFPRVGDSFVSNRRNAIMTLVEDTSSGVHDLLIAACDRRRYELLGAYGHASCEENLQGVLAHAGLDPQVVPQPVNLFMNVQIDADGGLRLEPSPASRGERVTLRAELDVLVVVSSCPQDLLPINNGAPKALGVTVGE